MNDFYTKINTKLGLYHFNNIDELDNTEFKTSPYNTKYILPNKDIKQYVSSIIPLPKSKPKEIIWQILKNPINSVYPKHIDAIRYCAINILISKPNDDHIFRMFDESGNFIPLDYNNNHLVPYIINVEKPHEVLNNSSTHNRYILSIGFFTKQYDYKFITNWFKERERDFI